MTIWRQAYNIADASSNISIKELAEMIASMGDWKVVMYLPTDVEKAGYNVVAKSVFFHEEIREFGMEHCRFHERKIETTIKEAIYKGPF